MVVMIDQADALLIMSCAFGVQTIARQFPVKVLAGIILLTSAPMARFMNKNVAGVNVPQSLIDEMASAPKGKAIDKGIEIAGRMVRRIREEKMCHGFTLWPLVGKNWSQRSWQPLDCYKGSAYFSITAGTSNESLMASVTAFTWLDSTRPMIE
ncbi:MAG TPA: hypothetical protein ENG73_01900, partial [Desulfobacterales bacterium]|nr:hypothetical protein [Desulfobacterales bacterium]